MQRRSFRPWVYRPVWDSNLLIIYMEKPEDNYLPREIKLLVIHCSATRCNVPFTVEQLENINAHIFHLGSLLADDFSLDVVKYLSTKGILAVDAQGYLREVRGEKVYPIDWTDKVEALKYIDILKVNEHEMEVLTGQTDIKQAALQLAEWGVKEVLITLGSLGSIIYAEGTFHKIPAYPPKDIVDATGCGDTYATGYLYMRNKGASYKEAGCFAAAMSTLKLEASGPFSKTEEDVWNIIRTSSLKAEKI